MTRRHINQVWMVPCRTSGRPIVKVIILAIIFLILRQRPPLYENETITNLLLLAGVLASILQGHVREAVHSLLRVCVRDGSVSLQRAQHPHSHDALQGRQDCSL